MVKSPRKSFKGYDFSVALYRNKDLIKVIIAAVSGYTVFLGATGTMDWKGFLTSVGVAVGGLVTKLISDALDYYYTEVEL